MSAPIPNTVPTPSAQRELEASEWDLFDFVDTVSPVPSSSSSAPVVAPASPPPLLQSRALSAQRCPLTLAPLLPFRPCRAPAGADAANPPPGRTYYSMPASSSSAPTTPSVWEEPEEPEDEEEDYTCDYPQPAKTQPVVLRPNQVAWAERALQLLETQPGYLDLSKPGSGKTPLLLWIAQQRGLPILVFGPVNAAQVWKREATKYGVRVIGIHSYAAARGSTTYSPHKYLTREEFDHDGVQDVRFATTAKYQRLLEAGVLVVLDEIQALKNRTAQSEAGSTLLRPFQTGSYGDSRFALLTGTPYDSEDHAFNLFRLLGIVTQDILYRWRPDQAELLGLKEAIAYARAVNPDATQRVLEANPTYIRGTSSALRPRSYADFYPEHFSVHARVGYKRKCDPCYVVLHQLYQQVLRPSIAGFIPAAAPDPQHPRSRDIKNGLYNMSRIDELSIEAMLSEWERQQLAKGHHVKKTPLVKIFEAIEIAKARTFIRLASTTLEAHPKAKVVISVNYLKSLRRIVEDLARYRPMVITGATKSHKRGEYELAFEADPKARLVVMITVTGGTAVSFHDRVGDAPRTMYLSPSWHLIPDVQATHRIDREGLRGLATIRMVYGKRTAEREAMILTLQAEKSGVLSETLDPEQLRDIVLPKDYATETEPDGPGAYEPAVAEDAFDWFE